MSQRGDVHIDLGSHGQQKHQRPPMSPQELAARRTAELGSHVSRLAGAAAIMCAACSFMIMMLFGMSLADTWGDVPKIALLVGAFTLAGGTLPTIAAIMERGNPREAQRIMDAWCWGMVSVAIGMAAYVAASTLPEQAAVSRSPETWTPRAMLPTVATGGRDSAKVRSLMLLLAGMGALVGSGVLGRWAVLGTAESYRLATGETGLAPAQQAQPAIMLEGAGGIMTQQTMFEFWAGNRIIPDASGTVSPNALLANYKQECAYAEVQPFTDAKFFNLLTSMAANSGGRVAKTKIDGKMFYRGWSLPGQMAEITDATYEDVKLLN